MPMFICISRIILAYLTYIKLILFISIVIMPILDIVMNVYSFYTNINMPEQLTKSTLFVLQHNTSHFYYRYK